MNGRIPFLATRFLMSLSLLTDPTHLRYNTYLLE